MSRFGEYLGGWRRGGSENGDSEPLEYWIEGGYALTVNPTIYTSCIKQFWATAKIKTVNKEVQIQALVDGRKVIITETSGENIITGKNRHKWFPFDDEDWVLQQDSSKQGSKIAENYADEEEVEVANDSFVPMDTEVVEGSKSQAEVSKKRTREELESDNSKKQKIDENAIKSPNHLLTGKSSKERKMGILFKSTEAD
ncbi:hypothetical protein Tco_0754836 [Tanacetum coccineum]